MLTESYRVKWDYQPKVDPVYQKRRNLYGIDTPMELYMVLVGKGENRYNAAEIQNLAANAAGYSDLTTELITRTQTGLDGGGNGRLPVSALLQTVNDLTEVGDSREEEQKLQKKYGLDGKGVLSAIDPHRGIAIAPNLHTLPWLRRPSTVMVVTDMVETISPEWGNFSLAVVHKVRQVDMYEEGERRGTLAFSMLSPLNRESLVNGKYTGPLRPEPSGNARYTVGNTSLVEPKQLRYQGERKSCNELVNRLGFPVAERQIHQACFVSSRFSPQYAFPSPL